MVLLNVLVHGARSRALQGGNRLGATAAILQWWQNVIGVLFNELNWLFISILRISLVVELSRHLLLNISLELVGVSVTNFLQFLLVIDAHLVQVQISVLFGLHVSFVVVVVH